MNPYIHRSHDKFQGVTVTQTDTTRNRCHPPIDIYAEVSLSHRSSSSDDSIYLHLTYFARDSKKPDLALGELSLLLNGSKRYLLTPKIRKESERIEEYSGWAWIEYIDYKLSKDILEDMVYAEKIEIKITGGATSYVLEKDGYHKTEIELSVLAKALYNAVFDESLFNDEIHNEVQRLKLVEQERQQTEAAMKIERRIKERKRNIGKTMENLALSGYPSALIVGGIWGFVIASWAPLIWLLVLVTVILIIMAIIRNS